MKTSSSQENILVKVNGETKLIPQNISILELLKTFNLNKDRVVIELNKNIIRKDDLESYLIKKNDELEIVTFVGGG